MQRTSFQSPPLPASVKTERNLPIKLSTVPAASLEGQGHRVLPVQCPKMFTSRKVNFTLPTPILPNQELCYILGGGGNKRFGGREGTKKTLEFELKGGFLFLVGLISFHLAQGFETVLDGGKIQMNPVRLRDLGLFLAHITTLLAK